MVSRFAKKSFPISGGRKSMVCVFPRDARILGNDFKIVSLFRTSEKWRTGLNVLGEKVMYSVKSSVL